MAVVIGDDYLLNDEIYYHTQYLRSFHDKFNKAQKQTKPNFTKLNVSDWIKVSALNKGFCYICDIEQQKPSSVQS